MSPAPGEELSHDAVLGALAVAAEELGPVTAPRPEFRAALRTRLLAVAAVAPAGRPTVRTPRWALGRSRSSRLGSVLAGVLAVAVGLSGAGVAASRSLPGEPLYGAKRAGEALQLRTADGPLETGLAHLHLAERRLREVQALADGRDSLGLGALGALGSAGALAGPVDVAGGSAAGDIREALAAMDDQTRTGSGLVLQAARATRDAAPAKVLKAWSCQQTERLRAVTAQLPAPARERAATSLSVLSAVGSSATALLPPGS